MPRKQYQVRLSDDETAAFGRAAARQGKTIATWLRELGREEAGVNRTNSARVFQGCETKQVNGVSGKLADAEAWYWEPSDYDGDVLWSKPLASRKEAVEAAKDEGYTV